MAAIDRSVSKGQLERWEGMSRRRVRPGPLDSKLIVAASAVDYSTFPLERPHLTWRSPSAAWRPYRISVSASLLGETEPTVLWSGRT